MKFLRKILALVIGVAFVAAVVISIGLIFAVKNINVTVLAYCEDSTENYTDAKKSLASIKGESILFVGSKDIDKAIEGCNYSLVSYEKVYPCTINVTVKERLETFAVFVGGQYSFYDVDGVYLGRDAENVNNLDGSPNVEVTGVAVEEIGEVAKVASVFKEKFNALRSLVSSIEVDSNPQIADYTEKLFFNFKCGLKIELDNYKERTEEKIEAAYDLFAELSDRQKLGGTLRSYQVEDGSVK
ncbi:MAG: hypothetical protein K2N22_05095, partial [Clostridia bacterium]|nr:hypothetical protein [Clostridia bacterium]